MRQSQKSLTVSELDRLFKAIKNPRDRAIFRLAYNHGPQLSELTALQLSDYHMRPGMLDHLVIRRDFGFDVLDHPVTLAIRSWLRKRGLAAGPLFCSQRGAAMSESRINGLIHRYFECAGIPQDKARFETFRNTCAIAILSDPRRSIMDVGRKIKGMTKATCHEYAQMAAQIRAVEKMAPDTQYSAATQYYAELVARTKQLEKSEWVGRPFATEYWYEEEGQEVPRIGGYVYFVETADGQHVKIGFSTRPRRRFSEFGTLRPSTFVIRLLGSIPGSRKTERLLHEKFASARDNGEWFRKTPELAALIAALLG